jgi:hypothetical protein
MFVGATPQRTKELMKALGTKYESTLWLYFHMKKPFPYDPGDWKPDVNFAEVLTRVGDKVFLGEVIYDGLAGFREIDIENGNMLVDSSIFIDGETGSLMREAEEAFFEQFAQFHILEGGTTQKQTKMKNVRQPTREPVTAKN